MIVSEPKLQSHTSELVYFRNSLTDVIWGEGGAVLMPIAVFSLPEGGGINPEHPQNTPGTAPEHPGTPPKNPWNTPGTPPEHPQNTQEHPRNTPRKPSEHMKILINATQG